MLKKEGFRQQWTSWLAVGLLVLAAMACQLGSNVEATPTPLPATDTPVPPTATTAPTQAPVATAAPDDPTPTPEPTPKPEITIQELQAATVRIFAKFESGGLLQTKWTGSGTIISPGGLILTNAHVAKPAAPGLATLYNDPQLLFSDEPDALVVALVENADRPPVETYIAEVLAADGMLDLAVLRIVTTLDGTPVDQANLNLPFVELGDSDLVVLGDEVRVLGFPGAGGETITFTRGDVSGFESQDHVGYRAWIKTDTTVSPGNSGGLGANETGQIIGVPTFAQEATGGAINRLRAINMARPLIEAAESGADYQSPFVVASSGNEEFRFVTWAEDFTEPDQCAIRALTHYPTGAIAAVAIFSYKGMTDGEQVLAAWFLGDELLATDVFSWENGPSGECFALYVHNYGDPISEGTYTIEVYVGGELDFVGSAATTVGGAVVTGGGVQVQGQITDADSGQPIEGAGVIFLNPGTDLDAWLDNPTEAEVYSLAETDANGEYQIPILLERGVTYPGVAAATGYRPNEGVLTIDPDDPDVLFINLQLGK